MHPLLPDSRKVLLFPSGTRCFPLPCKSIRPQHPRSIMSDTKTLYSEGEKLKDQGDFAGAAEKFKAVLQEKPDHVLAHLALAVTYGNLGQFAESVEHAEKACEIEPTDSFNFTAL